MGFRIGMNKLKRRMVVPKSNKSMYDGFFMPQYQRQPYRCPVCGGKGVIQREGNTTGDTGTKTCHGCNGRGWVSV